MSSFITMSTTSRLKPMWNRPARTKTATPAPTLPQNGCSSIGHHTQTSLPKIKMSAEASKQTPERCNKDDDTPEPDVRQEFEGPSLRAETVVVYLDRAEVCRSLRVRLRQGESELLLRNVSPCIDKDSVRVEARGPGGISIVDVSLQTRHLALDEQDARATSSALAQIKQDLLRQNKFRSKLLAKQQRLQKQREVLDLYLDSLMKPEGGQEGKTNHENLKSKLESSSGVLEGINSFFEMYNRNAVRLDDALDKNQVEIDDVQGRIEKNEKELAQQSADDDDREERELLLVLDTCEACESEIYITYVVTKAGWLPKYDIRVFSNDGTMKIVYHGVIWQCTGENWTDVKLCLSTAMPSIGGTVPELGTQTLAFRNRVYTDPPEKPLRRGRFGGSRKSNRKSAELIPLGKSRACADSESMLDVMVTGETGDAMTSSVGSEDSMTLLEMPMTMTESWPGRERGVCTAENSPKLWPNREKHIKESITSTMYEISRRQTIPCDNESHKVSVAIVDLKPTFEYECVPRKAAHAYLKAKTRNTSPYALLAGQSNIFLDNNFVAKSELRPVSPGEEFQCSLGVDPGVRITYRPMHKYREQSGIINKQVVTMYKQSIELRNTHNEPVIIQVTDHLPLSLDQQIKVTLQEPVIKHPEKHDMSKPIRLTKYNNVEWRVEIMPNESKDINLRYSVEHPAGEDIESQITALTNMTSSFC